MKDLFKYLLNKTKCQRSGICFENPIVNAINAVILNEIRQGAFYIIKLNELNLLNRDVLKEIIFALTVNISDTNISKADVLNFYNKIKEIKLKVKNFYLQKAGDSGISYEFITSSYDNNSNDLTEFIKNGESIVREFFNTLNEEKYRLMKVIILITKMAAIKLVELSNYKEINYEYYYETIRLLSVINYKTTREEKLLRRIKEFSNILYEIQKELDTELSKKFGKRQKGIADTDIYKGRSILVSGYDIEELYNLLKKVENEDINIYINPTLAGAIFYPEISNHPNFKGIFGIDELEIDFSKFKGAIYITQNSTQALDLAFRGSIYTTKIIPYDKAIKIDKNNLTPLIDEAKKLEGFDEHIKGFNIDFEYDIDKVFEKLQNIKDKKILIHLGLINEVIKEKFKDYEIINFLYPYETEGIYKILEKNNGENISIYFSECTKETITTTISLLNKNINEIYMANCNISDINPHITNSLFKDFNIKSV